MIMSGWEKRSSEVPTSDKTPPIHSTTSKSTNVNIDDLPDFLLVEILCQLPSKEFVFQCKCVSKHWLNLISDPYLIGRFLHLQRFHKQTPVARFLIDRRGEEFPRATQSSSNLLVPLFQRLMSFHGLEEKPYVVGTSNDLVLCCQTPHYQDQRDFYICNPCTRQWIALPPTTRSRTNVPLGFICDRYYEEEDSTSGTNSTVNIKKDYRCKVVRILPHDLSKSHYDRVSKFIVEIFSFETGEWRESIVASPRSIDIGDTSVAYNGMLYWTYTTYEPREETGLIRLDPFMIGNGSASSGRPNGDETVDDDQYQFRLFDAVENILDTPWICVRRGRLQMWAYYDWDYDFIVWELTGDDDLGSADEFNLKEVGVYPVTSKVLKYDDGTVLLALDPNDEDIFYVQSYPICYFMYNIRRRRWSRVASTKYFEQWWSDHRLFRLLELPRWPTPLRRLPLVEELPV